MLWKRKLHERIDRRQLPTLVASGVEFAADSQSARETVLATREVIVAAGALHSPQLLMLSGIGQTARLQELNIPTNIDLPGVGSNLQDHGRVWCWYPYNNASFNNPTELMNNETFASEALTEYWTSHSGPLTAAAVDGVAFPPLPLVVNGSTDIVTAAAAQSPQQYVPADVDARVLAGYTMQHSLMTNALQDMTRAAYELINANDGVLTVATMRPFSRGTVTLSSPEPFDPPVVDPRYGSNPVDIQVLQAALVFNQRLLYTESLSQLEPIQIFPPADAVGEEMVQYIGDRLQTEYHPGGTCAMMPLELGGVVSPELLVYGTQNLRVVDSSIMPVLPAAHLQAVVYGIAEKAADIIKAAQNISNASGVVTLTPEATGSSPTETQSSGLGQASQEAPPSRTLGSFQASATSIGSVTSVSYVTVVYTQTVYAP